MHAMSKKACVRKQLFQKDGKRRNHEFTYNETIVRNRLIVTSYNK